MADPLGYPFARLKSARRLSCRLLWFQKKAKPVSEKPIKTLPGSGNLKLRADPALGNAVRLILVIDKYTDK